MSTATAAPQSEQEGLHYIPLAEIEEDPSNVRQAYDKEKLAELAETFKTHGVLQPLMARKTPAGTLRLVIGHMRLRAAKLAGLQVVPVQVRELSDQAALEAQLIENITRTDLNPIEEAEAYRRLHKDFKLSADAIAAKTGESRGTVYAKLKASELEPAARKLAIEAKLSHSHVLELARLHPKVQLKATKEAIDGAFSVEGLQEHLGRNFALRLSEAPFDVKDATLDAKAGACAVCPFNLANQPDVESKKAPQLCLNKGCYENKKDLDWKRKAAAAKGAKPPPGARAPRVLSDKEAMALFAPFGGMKNNTPYVQFDDGCREDKSYRTYGDLLPKKVLDEHQVLARDKHGNVLHLLPKAGLKELLQAAGHDFWKAKPRVAPEVEASRKKELAKADKEEAIEEALSGELIERIVAKLEATEPKAEFWRHCVQDELENDYSGELSRVNQRRGWPEGELVKETMKRTEKMNASQLRALYFECRLYDEGDRPDEYAELLGIDVSKVRAEAKALVEETLAAEKRGEELAKAEAKKPEPEVKKAAPALGGKRRLVIKDEWL